MGERKRRLERFSAKHPRCCFCGGSAATETIDHVPPTVTFIGSQLPAPIDIEFPACKLCNASSKQYDQIAAMLALTSPKDPTEKEKTHFLKAVQGIQNNARAALEEIDRGFAGWGHVGREFGRQTGTQADVAALGPTNRQALFVLAAKLGMAYYYRQTGRIVPSKGAVVVDIITNGKLLRNEFPEEYRLASEFHTLSPRDTQQQFLLRHELMNDAFGGIFQFALQMNLVLIAFVVEDASCHHVKANDERVFVPGFLKTLTSPGPGFSTRMSFFIDGG